MGAHGELRIRYTLSLRLGDKLRAALVLLTRLGVLPSYLTPGSSIKGNFLRHPQAALEVDSGGFFGFGGPEAEEGGLGLSAVKELLQTGLGEIRETLQKGQWWLGPDDAAGKQQGSGLANTVGLMPHLQGQGAATAFLYSAHSLPFVYLAAAAGCVLASCRCQRASCPELPAEQLF